MTFIVMSGWVMLSARSAAADTQPASPVASTQSAGPTRELGLYRPGVPVSLEDGFRNPPAICRMDAWWQWHGSAVTKQEITRHLEEYAAKGMGGVTVKDTWSMPRDARTKEIADLPFMSAEWLDAFAHTARECARLGLICRSRYGSGWNSGGPWITPADTHRTIAFVVSDPIEGPGVQTYTPPRWHRQQTNEEVLKQGEAFLLALNQAQQQVVDLTGKVDADGKLTWNAPQGSWVLLSCFGKKAPGQMTDNASATGHGLCFDHMRPQASELHARHMAEPIRQALAPFGQTGFDGFEADSWEMGLPNWTLGFRKLFQEACGYDPVPYLPAAAGYNLGVNGERFLYDFARVGSDMIVENGHRRISEWCRRNGTAYRAQAYSGIAPAPMDYLQAFGAVDIPMGERTWAKVASSAAHAYGKRVVSCEILTRWTSTDTTPIAVKRAADAVFVQGVNSLCMSSLEYSPREAGSPGWIHRGGPKVCIEQAWWPMARPFLDYLGRCGFLLQYGEPVAHVAVYRTFMARDSSKDNHGYGWDGVKTAGNALPLEYALDYVNDELIQQLMDVRDNRIVLRSGASYEMLYIYPLDHPTMPLATLERIVALARKGARIVWAGKPPAMSAGLVGFPASDARFETLLGELRQCSQATFLRKHDYDALLPMLEGSPRPPAWKGGKQLEVVHRRSDEADIFLLASRKDATDTPVTFRITDRPPEFWFPDTGRIEPAPFRETKGGVIVPIRMAQDDTLFVVFRKGGSRHDGSAPPQPPASPPQAVTLPGAWAVEFPSGWGAPEKTEFASLAPWNNSEQQGIRYFNGIATYRKTFSWSPPAGTHGRVTLDLGQVCCVCEVVLNGKPLGIGWRAPYSFDASGALREGVNELVVRVAAQLHNRLVADASLPAAERVTRMAPEATYLEYRRKALVDSGLLGPVKIVPAN
jgi:hypothetical protein